MTSKIKEKKYHLGVRLTPELLRWLKARSEKEDAPMSMIVRRILTAASKEKGNAA